MIPQAHITAWAAHAPWAREEQIEQDLRRCLEGKLADAAFLADLQDLTTDPRACDANAAEELLLERIGLRLRNVPDDLLP